jgi:hypothetical protein
MNAQVLIDSLVRQVTVLIAQIATSGGVRAPISNLATQVFVDLSRELKAQGISRKVSADMFGMGLRAYVRKLRRLEEGMTEPGRTLWEAVLEFIRSEEMVSRERVLQRFGRDDPLQLQAILRDLVDSGLVFCSGTGSGAVYRAASESDLDRLSQMAANGGLDELVWVLIYRCGPITEEELKQKVGRQNGLADILERLLADGRVERRKGGLLAARDFVLPLGASQGWEAAVFDHLQAAVQTVCQRLRMSAATTDGKDVIGGSTYSYDIWSGHPLEGEVKGMLGEFRRRCGELRGRVEGHNRAHGLAQQYEQIVFYAGQCLLERELGELDENGGEKDG